MNSKYKMILLESKKLNGTGLLQKANANNITADKILYDYAIQMVSMEYFSNIDQLTSLANYYQPFNIFT